MHKCPVCGHIDYINPGAELVKLAKGCTSQLKKRTSAENGKKHKKHKKKTMEENNGKN